MCAVGAALAVLPAAASAQWRLASPAAAAVWYSALDSMRLPGPGAFAFTRSDGPPTTRLGRALAGERFEILHFLPLYFPSASRAALLDAVDDAAASRAPRTPRAQFAVGALRQSISDAEDRQLLADLAAVARGITPTVATPDQVAAWQDAWNRRFARPLAPFLAAHRLDAGMLLVIPALGPEGRIFAGLPADRADNLVAVGAPLGPADADGPLFAAVRELCFPLVSRVADAAPTLARQAPSGGEAARRASIAAVRCGAELLDLVLPAEAHAYRAHWRAAARAAADADFDALFPADPLLSPRLRAALKPYAPPR